MREILFRGKTERGEWEHGDLVRKYRENVILTYIYKTETGIYNKVLPGTVGQYVRQNDKKKIKVFSGDYIRNGRGLIREIKVDNFHGSRYMFGDAILTRYDCETGEIIGNVWDNPELLEVKE